MKSRNRAPLLSKSPTKGRGSRDCDWKRDKVRQWYHLHSWPPNCLTHHHCLLSIPIFLKSVLATYLTQTLCPNPFSGPPPLAFQPSPLLLHPRNMWGIILLPISLDVRTSFWSREGRACELGRNKWSLKYVWFFFSLGLVFFKKKKKWLGHGLFYCKLYASP